MTVVVAIGGPSGSGKTTVAAGVASLFGQDAVVLAQDRFFIDPSCCPPDANFCDPAYLKTEEWLNAVAQLGSGRPAEVPVVDFSTFTQVGTEELPARPVVIIEGMTIFRFEEVRLLADMAYYLAPSHDEIALRKRQRDARDRNKPQWVIDAQLKWVRSEHTADLLAIQSGSWAAKIEVVDHGSRELVDAIARRVLERRLR